jgi:fatty-acyl-CoA synthase
MAELSYVHGASDKPLLGEPIFQNLRRTASRFGNREALVVAHQDYRATYAELVAQCEEVARGLMARGVSKGDRVGIWSPNRYEWVVVQYATAAMGAILVNINPAYRTTELEYAQSVGHQLPDPRCRLFARRTTARCSPRPERMP